MMDLVYDRVEKSVRDGENAGYHKVFKTPFLHNCVVKGYTGAMETRSA